jgi:cathepsin L
MKFQYLVSIFISVVSFVNVMSNDITTNNNLTQYNNFESFLSTYGIDLSFNSNDPSYAFRKNIWSNEVNRIQNHNNKYYNNEVSWLESLNHMSIMTTKEKKAYLGYHKGINYNHKPLKQLRQLAQNNFDLVEKLSESVDWSKISEVTSAVKDQGQCGSCWAFAATATIESHVAINTGKLFDLSPQQIAACTPNPEQCGGAGNCQGATAELAFDYVASVGGMVEEWQYPYLSYYGVEQSCTNLRSNPKVKISGYIKLPENNYTALMNAVDKFGPIAVSVDASNWHSYKGGVFNGCNQVNPDINHAVVLTGYGIDHITGLKYWLIRNSWSASWGENGYIRILRSDNDESLCGTDITPQDGTACAGDTNPQKVCGTCGILFDSSYPVGATVY